MSGPKSYSVSVFDERLKNIFNLQAKIETIWKQIKEFSICDSRLKIDLDQRKYVQQNKEKIYSAIRSFNLGYKGTISPELYKQIDKNITEKISELSLQLNELQSVFSDCQNLESDFECYKKFEQIIVNTNKEFDDYKNSVVIYFENFGKVSNSIGLDKDVIKIKAVSFKYELSPFYEGFRTNLNEKKTCLLQGLLKSKGEINNIRIKLGNSILQNLPNKTLLTETKEGHVKKEKENIITNEIQECINAIESLFLTIDDSGKRKYFNEQLEKCKTNHNDDIFFFNELHDMILDHITDQNYRASIKKFIKSIKKRGLNESLLTEADKFMENCYKILSCDKIKSKNYFALESMFEKLLVENTRINEEQRIKLKEQAFIKEQIVNALKNLNYEVLEETNIVDFEEDNDYLFSTPDGEDYVNLRIDKNGEIKYNFLIENNKNYLSDREKKNKLENCRKACGDLKSITKGLRQTGLEMNLKKERPINEDALISLNSKHRLKVSQKNIKQQKEDSQIKFLRKEREE
jgi:hypothetical protein